MLVRKVAIVGCCLVAAVQVYVLATIARFLVQVLFPLWVWSAEVRGQVSDEQGRPVAGARVVAEYFGDHSVEPLPGSRSPAISDENGAFVLFTVPGAVTLFARKAELGIRQPLDLELHDGEELAGVELRLDPGGRIVGECVTADGTPWPGRWIVVEQAGYRHWRDEDGIASVRTGAAGEFAFDRVPSGDVRVMLGRGDSQFFPYEQEQIVHVRRDETTRVHFESGPFKPRQRRR
jgi:hypothetical protein